ncbi:MAG TPA: putative Ig domain-containing protein, partial [Acidobacteriota bacterium]|nr:putative Ig domain-containing protein [Acidobacteriota bacterium]
MGYTGFVYGRRSVAIRLGVSLCLIVATLLSVWSAQPVTEVKAAGRGAGMFRQTPVNVSFNSPTITPGTTSVQIEVSLTVGSSNNARPGTVEIEIPVDPAVVDVDVPEYTRTAGPLIPNTYQSTDLFAFPLQLGDASAIRIELVPPNNNARVNSGTGVFCTVTVPIRSTAPTGSYPLDASADNPFATRFTQAIADGGNEIPFTTTPGTLTISDGGGCPAISISPTTLPNGTVGTVYNQTISATGGQSPYTFSVTSGSLPTGLSLSSAGAITGTPTVPNSFSFTVRATDANQCSSSRTYTLTIDAVPCPTITISPSTLPNAAVGTNYNQVLTASGGQAPYTFSLLSGALPTGIALSSSGTLSGTPTASGTSNFTIRVIDNNGCVVTPSYSLKVDGPECPTITVNPASLPGGTIGTAYNQVISATGGTAPYAFTVLSGSLPPGVTLATNGTLSGTPSSAGSFTFTVRATDTPGCTGQRTYTVAITGS